MVDQLVTLAPEERARVRACLSLGKLAAHGYLGDKGRSEFRLCCGVRGCQVVPSVADLEELMPRLEAVLDGGVKSRRDIRTHAAALLAGRRLTELDRILVEQIAALARR